jgi:hypothetical protein
VTRFWQSSNAQCEQCNHTHSENQHCKCYRIVVQPMQPLLHGTPRFRSMVGNRDNLSGRLGFRCSERKAPERLSQAAGNQRQNPPLGEGCGGVPRSLRSEDAAAHWRRLCVILLCVWVKRTGTRRQVLSFWVMNRFRPKPAMSRVTIAVALMGAAITIGLAIWHSQKGKTQGPAIIDNQHVSQGQR